MMTVLRPFGKAWWACWLDRVERGEAVGLMGELARRGRPFQVAAVEAPAPEAAAALTPVVVESQAYTDWCRYFRCRGVTLPRPEVKVVFLPAAQPPWTTPPVMMMARSPAQTKYAKFLKPRDDIADALLQAGWLAAWDRSGRAADYKAARDAFLLHWARQVISHGVDLSDFSIVAESALTAEQTARLATMPEDQEG